jgi:2-oxoglutarate dehydrogenase E2 component (dihydrolipoamide succinyltransferase)
MIVDVVMPKMGESINDGTILEWRKKIGDSIQLDETLLEIGTDKVDSEIPSSAAGIVIEILAGPNDVKEVGEVIARIDTGGDGGISESTLSVPISNRVSSSWIESPIFFLHSRIVPSLMDSPILGITTSTII